MDREDASNALVRVTAATFLLLVLLELWIWVSAPPAAQAASFGRQLSAVFLLAPAIAAMVRPELARHWLAVGALAALAPLAVTEGASVDPNLALLAASAVPVALLAPGHSHGVLRVPAWTVALAVLLASGALNVYVRLANDDPLVALAWQWRGWTERDSVDVLTSQPFGSRLPLPAGSWHRETATGQKHVEELIAQLEAALSAKVKTGAVQPRGRRDDQTIDRAMTALLNEELKPSETVVVLDRRHQAAIELSAAHAPAVGESGLAELVAQMKASAVREGFQVGMAPLDVPGFEDGWTLTLDNKAPHRELHGCVSFLTQGDLFFEIAAAARVPAGKDAPSWMGELASKLSLAVRRRPVMDAGPVARVKGSTVLVLTPKGSGSGFVVSNANSELGIVTNAHVVNEGGAQPAHDIEVVFSDFSDTGAVKAHLVSVRRDADLALLSVPAGPRAPPPLELRAALPLPAGTPAFVVGYPLGVGIGSYGLYPTPTVNAGRLSARAELPDNLQRAAVPAFVGVNPGNSGGPVVDASGAVMGVAVAHVPGSELSFLIPAERVQSFLTEAATGPTPAMAEAPPPQEPPAADGPSDADPALSDALVIVSVGENQDAGVVVQGPGNRLLVATRHSLVHDPEGGRRDPIKVVFFAGTPRRHEATAEIARSIEVDDVAVLTVKPFDGSPRPLALESLIDLPETSALSLAAFKVDEKGHIDLHGTRASWRAASLSARSFDDLRELVSLRIDAGVNHGLSGGAVLDPDGKLLGLATSAERGSNVTLVVPAPIIRRAMDGGLRGGEARWVADGVGHCFLQLDLGLDDPLHTVRSVGVALQVRDEANGRPSALDGRFMYGETAAEAAPSGTSSEETITLAVTPSKCDQGWLGYQLWTDSGHGRRLDPQRYVRQVVTTNSPSSTPVEGGLLAGDVKPPKIGAARPFTPPANWGTVCDAAQDESCRGMCLGGDATRCFALGLWKRETSPEQAESYLSKACDAFNFSACNEVSILLQKRRQWRDAFKKAEVACAGGYARGCTHLGELYGTFTDRQPDGTEALRALRRGCQLGDGLGCTALGMHLAPDKSAPSYGRPPPADADKAEAFTAFARACQLSEAGGCVNLARCFRDGISVAPDVPRSARLYEKGCELGDGYSCANFGEAAQKGRGTTRSILVALIGYRAACVLGYDPGCAALEGLARSLPRDFFAGR